MARPIQSKQLNADVTVSQPTVAALEALPGPQATAPQLTWIQELEAFYVFVPGSVAVVDHFTVLGVTGGVAGRWILQSEAITLQPRGGGIDDQPTIQAAVNACAGVCSIVLGTGTFQIIAAQVTFPLTAPSILEWAGPETIVNCQLGGGHGACFLADAWTPRTPVTTLSAPTTFNSPNISTVGALPANGSKLVLVSGIVSGLIINATYTLISGGGTMNGVVDRGILKPFPGGATVASTAGFPTVQFIGNGGMIQGTGDFAIEILCGDHCLIDNLCLVSSFSRWGFNFDYCTNFSTMRRNRITYVANGASWACGMEQTENSCIEDTYIGPGFTGEAVAIDAIENGWVTGVEAPGSNCGILVQPIGPTDPRGTNNLLIQACVFAGSIDCGIKLVDANQNITVDACDTTGSANGLKVTLGNNTVYTSDLRVMNNCFVNSANSGVQVDGGNRHRYVNNDCSGSGTGLAVNGTGLCDDLQTVGLVANDCTGFGVIFLTTNVTGVRCWGTIAKRAAQWGCEVTCVDAEFYACDFTDGGYLTNVKGCIYVLANTPRVLFDGCTWGLSATHVLVNYGLRIDVGADVSVRNCTWNTPKSGSTISGIFVNSTAAVVRASNFRLVDGGGAGAGTRIGFWYNAAGSLWRGEGVDVSACETPYMLASGTLANFAAFTANGTTPVIWNTANTGISPLLLPDVPIRVSLKTHTGTQSGQPYQTTGGISAPAWTSFASDTSAYYLFQ